MECGTKSQPWRLEAPTGQHIVINLFHFTSQSVDQYGEQHSGCQQYGYIIDKPAKKNVSICGSRFVRNEMVYKSSSNVVEVVLDVTSNSSNKNEHSAVIILIGLNGLVKSSTILILISVRQFLNA